MISPSPEVLYRTVLVVPKSSCTRTFHQVGDTVVLGVCRCSHVLHLSLPAAPNTVLLITSRVVPALPVVGVGLFCGLDELKSVVRLGCKLLLSLRLLEISLR